MADKIPAVQNNPNPVSRGVGLGIEKGTGVLDSVGTRFANNLTSSIAPNFKLTSLPTTAQGAGAGLSNLTISALNSKLQKAIPGFSMSEGSHKKMLARKDRELGRAHV